MAPQKSASLEIEAFVEIASIDPIYYDKPYYLMPTEAAARPYKLLIAEMEKAKKVGIARSSCTSGSF